MLLKTMMGPAYLQSQPISPPQFCRWGRRHKTPRRQRVLLSTAKQPLCTSGSTLGPSVSGSRQCNKLSHCQHGHPIWAQVQVQLLHLWSSFLLTTWEEQWGDDPSIQTPATHVGTPRRSPWLLVSTWPSLSQQVAKSPSLPPSLSVTFSNKSINKSFKK